MMMSDETEFSDEIRNWVIKEEFAKIGLDTQKSILKQDVDLKATEGKRLDVMRILKEEFDS
jgi:N utilization substance protein A